MNLEELRVVCKEEILKDIADVPLVFAGKLGLSCEQSVLWGLEKSKRGFRSGSGGRRREVQIRAGDCASVVWESEASLVQSWENVFCFGDVGAVARNVWVASAKDAVSVTE